MRETRSQFKERLVLEGRWGEYLRRREELVLELEDTPQATAQAMREFGYRTGLSENLGLGDALLGIPSSDGVLSLSASLADFEGKRATVLDQVLWVARHMGIFDVTPEMCPDPAAWNLLCECRRSSDMRGEFWLRMYAKAIPSRIPEQVDDDDEYDGKDIVNLCDILLEIGNAVE